jgi:hypothetical protein
MSMVILTCRSRWPLGYWDRGFESRSGHGRLPLCVVLCRYRPLRRADHLSRGILSCVWIRSCRRQGEITALKILREIPRISSSWELLQTNPRSGDKKTWTCFDRQQALYKITAVYSVCIAVRQKACSCLPISSCVRASQGKYVPAFLNRHTTRGSQTWDSEPWGGGLPGRTAPTGIQERAQWVGWVGLDR